MVKECGKKMIKKIQINMRVDIKMIRNMDMENFNGILAVNIKVIMSWILKKDMGKCFGQMALFIEDFGIKANRMELVL